MTSKIKKYEENEDRAKELLIDETVNDVMISSAKSIFIQFKSGKRLFLDHKPEEIEISITEG